MTTTRMLFAASAAACALLLPELAEARTIYNPSNEWDQRLFVIAFHAAFGFGIGWFISPRARTVRRIAFWALVALIVILTLPELGWVSWGAAYLLSFGLFWAGIGWGLRQIARGLMTPPDTFGSAKWASFEDVERANLAGDEGIRLGRYGAGSHAVPLSYKGDRHLLTVAPTRSGKGTTAIVPNLLTYEGSMLVIDPKGENALITAKRRKEMGQDVHVVDPWGIAADCGLPASRFNPLDWLKAGDVDITENAMLLADALVVKDGDDNPFFFEEARAYLQGNVLDVATDEAEAGQRHLGRVRDRLLLDGQDMPQLYQRMTESPHHVVASTGARSLQKDPKLLSNVLASAQAQTHFLDSGRIRESLSASDFTFEDLKEGRTTIYLVLPADRLHTFGRWLRLLIQQAITVNARNIAVQPEKPVLFILDEMPALGRLAMIEEAYAVMAGFGFQIWGIVQDMSQLKRIYGDSWETFVANAGVLQTFGASDRFSTDYISAACGVATVWSIQTALARSFSTSSGKDGGSNSSSTSETTTTSVVKRPLILADEIRRLRLDRQLLLIEDANPIQGAKVPWFMDEQLKGLGRNLKAEQLQTRLAGMPESLGRALREDGDV